MANMTKRQAQRFLANKAKQAAKQSRIAKARALCAKAGHVSTSLALEVLKAQERKAKAMAKRQAKQAS